MFTTGSLQSCRKKSSIHSQKKLARRRGSSFFKYMIFLGFFLLVLYFNYKIIIYMDDNLANSEAISEITANILLPTIAIFVTALVSIATANKFKVDLSKKALHIIRWIATIVVALCIVLLISSVVQGSFASINIAKIKNSEQELEAENSIKDETENMPLLEIFDWKEDLYIENIKNYIGKNVTDDDIEFLCKQYLKQEFVILNGENGNGNYEAFETCVVKAAEFQIDYESVSTIEVKIYACKKVCQQLEMANAYFTDVACLKMTGDYYTALGDLGEQKITHYEKALHYYIDALHVIYNQSVDSPIKERDVWKEISNVYAKIGSSGEKKSGHAQKMAIACKNIFDNMI